MSVKVDLKLGKQRGRLNWLGRGCYDVTLGRCMIFDAWLVIWVGVGN